VGCRRLVWALRWFCTMGVRCCKSQPAFCDCPMWERVGRRLCWRAKKASGVWPAARIGTCYELVPGQDLFLRFTGPIFLVQCHVMACCSLLSGLVFAPALFSFFLEAGGPMGEGGQRGGKAKEVQTQYAHWWPGVEDERGVETQADHTSQQRTDLETEGAAATLSGQGEKERNGRQR
jgi:hypothetical protein